MRASQIVSVIGITAIYATCFAAIKAGLAFAPPLLFGGLRALIGGVALLVVAVILHEPLLPGRRDWRGVLALALIATTFTFGAMFLSPGRTGAGVASVLGNLQPLATAALAVGVLGERLTGPKAAGLVLGLLGVTLIAYPALAGTDVHGLSGAALALMVSVGSATGNVIVKRMNVVRRLLAIAAWPLMLGSLPLLATSALAERDTTVNWSIEFAGLLLFLALAGTSLVTAVWYKLLQKSDVGRLTTFFYLVPIFGLGLAALVFRETISSSQGVGVVFALVGVVVAAREFGSTSIPAIPQTEIPPNAQDN